MYGDSLNGQGILLGVNDIKMQNSGISSSHQRHHIKVNDNENTAAYALQAGMDGMDLTY